MKIALLRHFKVNYNYPSQKWLNKDEIIQWFEGYDNCTELEINDIKVSTAEYPRAYSSTLIRALLTAQSAYQGPLASIEVLREFTIFNRLPNLRLPFILWAILIQIMTQFPSTQKKEYLKSLEKFLEDRFKESSENIVLTSHYFTMNLFAQILKKKGFEGPKLSARKYGVVYEFSKKSLNL